MSDLSREQFVDQVLERVRSKFPLVKITGGGPPFTLRVNGQTVGLENIYRMVALHTEEPADRLHQIDRWVVELLRASEGTPDNTGSYADLKDRILPMVVTAGAGEAYKGTVHTPLVDGLLVAYAIDQDRTISYIPRERFEAWNVSIDDLHTLAIDNLVARSEQLAAHAAEDEDGEVNLILFQTMDGYDASRILLPTLHERLREYLGSPFGAAIPNRDMLLCFRNDDATVGRLRQQVAADYRSMPHQVTDRLLLVTADGIAVRD
jgi:uncharacterized protein YtpQ (UPF0354 family)